MTESSCIVRVIRATLGSDWETARAEYASIEAILINLEHCGPIGHGVTTASLNVRKKPGASAPVLGTLTAGTPVVIWGRTPKGDWLAVEQFEGWVSSQYVKEQ